MDGDNMKNKFITSILIVIIIIILVVGITFAYITWRSDNINNSGNSECFDILYVKGTNYAWISNDLIENSDAFSNYYGKITASVEQYDY